MKFARLIVRARIPILVTVVILMAASIFGMINTRINYDMLDYLPSDMDTIKGQNELLDEFGKGGFSMIIIEDMPDRDVVALKAKIEQVDVVDSVIWYSSLLDISVPKEILPDRIYRAFNAENSTMMVVFFSTSTSADETMDAIKEIRSICGRQCFVSGMSASVTDLKDLCEKEEPVYVAIAVTLAVAAMLLLLDNWLVPFLFLASIGSMILLNLGTNVFLGEISYITKALSAVLQLAVTMDYSIFLWRSYNEEKQTTADRKEAMALAIRKTFSSVLGSSITTVAGFIALCFMSFTLGRDLGVVMSKGVVLGVLGCVTVLPAMILVFDKPLQKCSHRSLIPDAGKLSRLILKVFPALLLLFVLVAVPSFFAYRRANDEVYYNLSEGLPEDLDYAVANSKLAEDYHIGSTHMLLIDAGQSPQKVRAMIDEMERVDGVSFVLGLESIVGARVPEEVLPEEIVSILKGDRWNLMLVGSEYRVATDEVNRQIDALNGIVKRYNENSLLIGEAPCTKDMIETTDTDFKVVNAISIVAIFVIILLVEQSAVLPLILIAVIEVAIFINLGASHLLGDSLPFIAPICISTIQLGATVDYAILMTTRYKTERLNGKSKADAVRVALSTSIPSIIVSGMGLFAATFGVALYSDIEIISFICMLLARGAIISMVCVVFFLPPLLRLCDRLICKTTLGMTKIHD